MRKVYMSFLGLGPLDKKTDKHEYSLTVYELNGIRSGKTKFVQAAEIEILGADSFDELVIVTTQKAYGTHFKKLEAELRNLGASTIHHIIISEEMTSESQWHWFEQILNYIEFGDMLTIDMTHGYRSVPVVFSSAINFFQKARNITLQGVYYGAFGATPNLTSIINMKDFYIVNEWAEAVSRLVEDADARKLAQVAATASASQAGGLNDEDLINSFEELTNCIRNVDIHNVAAKADAALSQVASKQESASPTGKILLRLVIEKFTSLATESPSSRLYDKNYFLLQLEIIRMLLEHRLYMQAYTVMREFIGSIGMIAVEKADRNNSKGRGQRQQFAEVFIQMVENDRNNWKFSQDSPRGNKAPADRCVELTPYYDKLQQTGIVEILHSFAGDMNKYRNGFAHAWTAKSEASQEIKIKGEEFYGKLKEVINCLDDAKVFDSSK